MSFGRLYVAVLHHALTHSDYNAVIVLTEPPMIYLAALLFKMRSRTRVVLWSLDCYPEVAVEAGVIRRHGMVHRLMKALNRWGYPFLDAVVALDDDMAEHLTAGGARNVVVIHNWESAEDYGDISHEERVRFRSSLGLKDDDVFVLYLGNMGVAHEFATILDAIRQVSVTTPQVKVVFIGGGARKAEVIEYLEKHQISDIIVSDFVSKKKTRIALGSCDLGLVTLRREMVGLVTPSKVYGYLAMSVPVLFVGPSKSEVGSVIAKTGCGGIFELGDVRGLSDYLAQRPQCKAELQVQGTQGRAFFLNNYEASVILPKFEVLLDRVVNA